MAAHGGKVVYARTATEVADFVLELAKERGAQLIVKSKSMTTEEIDFNERLEHHELESVETDLGEYILQLAHERPYHIVAPALHMTRYDVADIFTEKLGVANEVVIEKQTQIARGVLREKFLAADIGISGANFLIADSGAVVLVENEGNARLTTSAPKIHIAMAGIEKLIPRAQDLAVFLKLLARSATGQALRSTRRFFPGRGGSGRSRRTGRVLRGAARQRAHQAAGRSGQAAIAVLHPLRRVPEPLPGVSQDRRAQLSVDLFGADRRDHHAAISRCEAGSVAAVRIEPVRRVRGGLSGEDRDPETAAAAPVGSSGGAGKRGRGTSRVPDVCVDDAASADVPDVWKDRSNDVAAAEGRSMDPAAAGIHERGAAAELDGTAGSASAGAEELSPDVEGAGEVSESRTAILGRIRSALGRKAGQAPPVLPVTTLRTRNLSTLERVELFVRQFEKLNGKPIRVRDRGEAAAAVRDLINGHTAVASNAPFLSECGITDLAGRADRVHVLR